MKYRWSFAVILSLVMLSATAQFRKIPAVVTDSFKTKFENATKVSWKDNISNFQASFKIDNDNAKAYYSSKGEWLKTERSYSIDGLAEEIKDGLKKSKYASWPVKEILYVEEHNKQPQYKVLVRKGDLQKKNLYFSTTGQLLDDSITL
jgi:hypothetical protein